MASTEQDPQNENARTLFLVRHTHNAEDCESAYSGWERCRRLGLPIREGGAYCMCRAGDHVAWQVVEGRDAAEQIATCYTVGTTIVQETEFFPVGV